MHRFLRKIYISLLTIITVIITMFATTYAWVGILSNSTFEKFELNIRANKLKNYNLLVSGDDENYFESIPSAVIKKQILNNMGIDCNYDPYTQSQLIDDKFMKNNYMEQVTTYIRSDNTLDDFKYMPYLNNGDTTLKKTNKYFKFDIYLKVIPTSGVIENENSININLVLNNIENTITGTKSVGTLLNANHFSYAPSDNYNVLNNIPRTFSIDSSNAARFSLSIYNPISVADKYTTDLLPNKTLIYQGGSYEPSYNDGIYNLGGILPEEDNFAIQELNSIYKVNIKMDDKYLNRKDLECKSENSMIWKSPELNDSQNYLGIQNGIQTKMKITVCFWFEGWDADCINFINKSNAILNLVFASDIDDEN